MDMAVINKRRWCFHILPGRRIEVSHGMQRLEKSLSNQLEARELQTLQEGTGAMVSSDDASVFRSFSRD